MTKLQVASKNSNTRPGKEIAVQFVFEGTLKKGGLIDEHVLAAAKSDRFKGKKEQDLLVHSNGKTPRRTLLVGLGALDKAELSDVRDAAGRAAGRLKSLEVKQADLYPPDHWTKGMSAVSLARCLSEGMLLGAYSYDDYRGKKPESEEVGKATLWVKPKDLKAVSGTVKKTGAICEAVRFTRDLVNRPPSDTYPEAVAREAVKIARQGKNIRARILRKKDIEAKKMVGLLGVNRGSEKPPVFIHLHYKPSGAKKTVALVGKGVTFDSGGLSLKPPKFMEDMKCDMAGCASVLGMIKAASAAGLKVEIHAICPVTENLTGGNAMKPGDVLSYSNGVTAEVLNTDAEGRLILADALIYASKLKPDQVIDFATLTGAAIVALGMEISGLMSDDEKMVEGLLEAGKTSGETLWRLPLFDSYNNHIKSRIADIKNIGNGGEAGTITAGLFLKRFVDVKKWAHVDIAGPAFLTTPFGIHPAGATGIPVRTIVEYLDKL